MNPTDAHKQFVTELFAATAQGDWRPLVDSFADDFCWTISGHSSWARRYEGKPAVLKQLFAHLRGQLAGPIKNTALRVLGEGDTVIVEAVGDNTTVGGAAYNNRYCFVIRLEGRQLKEVTEYADTDLFRVLGAPAVAETVATA